MDSDKRKTFVGISEKIFISPSPLFEVPTETIEEITIQFKKPKEVTF